jgi:Rrf2 family protein
MYPTRFTVAIHIVTLLAYCGEEAQTSAFIAGSVNTNPVVIRRLLGNLRQAGLVTSQGGPGGGWQLLRAAGEITLKDIFLAMEADPLFPLHAAQPNPDCPVGRDIQAVLQDRFRVAQDALEAELERTTIRQLIEAFQPAR